LFREIIVEFEIEVEKTEAVFQIGELPVICAVPALIRQVFYNLVSNALKFRKPSISPLIKISAEKIEMGDIRFPAPTSVDSSYHKISISDNGIGFDVKYANDIFVVFKRLNSYHEYNGSGVGLAICKKIIENHNGFIIAESKVGEGSTFTIALPENPRSAF